MKDSSTVERWSGRQIFGTSAEPYYIQWTRQQDWSPHDHDFVEVVLVTGGTARHRTAQQTLPLSEGDILMIRPHTWHAYEQCRRFRICNFCFGLEILSQELSALLPTQVLSYLTGVGLRTQDEPGVLKLHLPSRSYRTMKWHLQQMTRILSGDAARHRAAVIGHMLIFFDQWVTHSPALQGHSPQAIPEPILRAIKMMEEKPTHSWTVGELSQKLDLNYSYFIRCFKRVTGLSPLAYLSRLRARRAASLLLRSDEPIGQIAQAVGWPNPYYFSRRFRAYFGMSASAYRRHTRKYQ